MSAEVNANNLQDVVDSYQADAKKALKLLGDVMILASRSEEPSKEQLIELATLLGKVNVVVRLVNTFGLRYPLDNPQ